MRNDLPRGFLAATAEAAFRKAGRADLGLIFSELPATFAAMFTTNRFCAAPVQIGREILASARPVRAVVANSGQANSCTGQEGLAKARESQRLVAELLDIEPGQVVPISTGVIGEQLKLENLRKALPELRSSLGRRDAEGFTRAFMTTDAFPKFAMRDLALSGGSVRLTVMAKGAGMICPNMATMLCVALSDAALEREAWQGIFKRAVEQSFNRVSVDGDTSTNDTILGLANGASGVTVASKADLALLEEALTAILKDVARMLVADGEGSAHVIAISVTGASDDATAKIAARAIAASPLVKTAIYGGDANWGRIINALGYSGAVFDPAEVSLSLCGIERFRQGQPVNAEREAELAAMLKAKEVQIAISLGQGPGSYTMLSSDLGHEYVSLNADYRS